MKYKIGKSDLFYFENKQRKYIPVVSLSQEHDYIFNLHDVENDRKNTLLFLNNDVGIISLNEDKSLKHIQPHQQIDLNNKT